MIGLVCAGLPLIDAFVKSGFRYQWLNADPKKVELLNSDQNYAEKYDSDAIKEQFPYKTLWDADRYVGD
ncbi:hypothetical protein Mal65_42880 [Crateriforma conspicua]|nr:hypothetical protein Mal65_42880 [Crateriforma conspicua]